jgi:hypothetical protein
VKLFGTLHLQLHQPRGGAREDCPSLKSKNRKLKYSRNAWRESVQYDSETWSQTMGVGTTKPSGRIRSVRGYIVPQETRLTEYCARFGVIDLPRCLRVSLFLHGFRARPSQLPRHLIHANLGSDTGKP